MGVPIAPEAVAYHRTLERLYIATAPDKYRFSVAAEARRLTYQRMVAKAATEYINNLTQAYGGIPKMLRVAHRMVRPEPKSIFKAFVRGSGKASDPHMAAALRAVLLEKAGHVSQERLMIALAFTARDGLRMALRGMGLETVQKAAHNGIDWTTPVEAWTELFPELKSTVSEYIQGAVGQNAEEVANLLVNAADYNNPETMQNVSRRIREDVETLNARQANMIARTETARVYGETAMTAMQRNGVPSRRWLTIASGHAGGVRSSSMRGLDAHGRGGKGQVCDDCLGNSMQGWVPIGEPFKSGDNAPPAHPWCRCDVAGNFQNWLPPKAGDVWPDSEFDGISQADLAEDFPDGIPDEALPGFLPGLGSGDSDSEDADLEDLTSPD